MLQDAESSVSSVGASCHAAFASSYQIFKIIINILFESLNKSDTNLTTENNTHVRNWLTDRLRTTTYIFQKKKERQNRRRGWREEEEAEEKM